ncbi:hypothetical protein BV22DRAFT_727175 [Leucogyrophana mollusca]|uniref:Uncharacterized protein n=1 Tax=Leucogyrophana mollusca TaxID=85980 RepID=A0ACB8B6W0_9AGAM|nr:hypothetical protein BV22DRAFT_727175 [Leucogyrophana mollusca]
MPQVLFPPASLDGLVDDVLIQVLQTSSVSTILSLRQTSKRYYFLTGLRCIWYAKFCTEVLARNLPIPGPSHSLSVLHSEELEYRTLRALYLQRKWPRLSPQVHAASSRKSDPVDQVVLIQGGAQVLTVHANRVVCWDIGGGSGDSVSPGVRRIAEWSSPGEGKTGLPQFCPSARSFPSAVSANTPACQVSLLASLTTCFSWTPRLSKTAAAWSCLTGMHKRLVPYFSRASPICLVLSSVTYYFHNTSLLHGSVPSAYFRFPPCQSMDRG